MLINLHSTSINHIFMHYPFSYKNIKNSAEIVYAI